MPETGPGYHCDGEGEGIILLHASLSSKKQWRGLLPLLATRYRVLALDLYGYGDVPLPAARPDFTLRDEVELVRRLKERFFPGGAPCRLVGHSYGGAVALAFCHFYPEEVTSICAFEPVSFHLIDQGHPDLGDLLQMARSLDLYVAQGKPDLAARTFLDYWGGAGTYDAYPARLKEEFAARTPKLHLDFQAISHTPITLAACAALRLPVTLIVGRETRPQALLVAEALRHAMPHCTLHTVPAGHLAPISHPHLVEPLILTSVAPP